MERTTFKRLGFNSIGVDFTVYIKSASDGFDAWAKNKKGGLVHLGTCTNSVGIYGTSSGIFDDCFDRWETYSVGERPLFCEYEKELRDKLVALNII